MAKYHIFTDKEVSKQNKELVELHKRCIKTYLVQKSMRTAKRNKFFVIYDYFVNEKNITELFFRPIPIFIRALIIGQLDQITNYFNNHEKPKRKRRSKRV